MIWVKCVKCNRDWPFADDWERDGLGIEDYWLFVRESLCKKCTPTPLPTVTTPHAWVRKNAHQSEIDAANFVRPRTGTQRAKALDVIVGAGAHGATDYEISQAIDLIPPRVASRRKELVQMGWIEESGKTRPTPGGIEAIVWVLTDKAQTELGVAVGQP